MNNLKKIKRLKKKFKMQKCFLKRKNQKLNELELTYYKKR